MTSLQTLTLLLYKGLSPFLLELLPDPNSTNPIPCPELKALTFRTEDRFEIETMVEVAALRAVSGAPFNSVRIINRGELVPREGVMELKEHVSHVETSFEVHSEVCSYGDYSDQEDLDEGGGRFGDGSSRP